MQWSEERSLNLIKVYKEKPILWDAKHPRHYNKTCKNEAWEEIASVLKTSVDNCKKKMITLLSSLRRERSKLRNSLRTGQGATEIYKSGWFAFDSLSFLLDRNNAKETINSISHKFNEGTEEAGSEEFVENEIIKEELGGSSLIEKQIEPTVTTSNCTSKKRKRVEEHRLETAFNILEASASKKDDSECMHFGKFIGSKMENYSITTKNAVQQAIMQIMFDADGGFYESTSNTLHHFLTPHPENISTDNQVHHPQHKQTYQEYSVTTSAHTSLHSANSTPTTTPSPTALSPNSSPGHEEFLLPH